MTYLTGVRYVRDDIDISTDADPIDVDLNVQDAPDRYALIPTTATWWWTPAGTR